MANPTLQYPLINGNRYEWASIEIVVRALRLIGVKSCNYSQELAPGEVYGTHAQKLGRTRGELKPEASIEMFKEEWIVLLQTLGDGFMEVPFDVPVAYSEGGVVVVDVIRQARLKKVDDSHSQSTDALTVKLDLDVMWIEYAGRKPLTRMLGG